MDTFAFVVRSGKNKSLVEDLKAWAENPRYARLTSATVESLLRWTTTGATTWKASLPYAYEVWAYLFGTPAPTWKNWSHGESRYEFDAEGWRKWFESLSGAVELSSDGSTRNTARLSISIEAHQSFVLLSLNSAPPGVANDDLLDAAAAAWTALRRHRGEAVCVCPPERDAMGLEVTICY